MKERYKKVRDKHKKHLPPLLTKCQCLIYNPLQPTREEDYAALYVGSLEFTTSTQELKDELDWEF
jgi:hypothetical protein